MQEFIEERFPTDISIGMRGGPEFSTNVILSMSGHEYRNINWLDAKNRYQISKSITNPEDLEKILSFFRHSMGQGIGFRFKDHADFRVTNQLLYTADGKSKTFQMFKTYKLGKNIYRRKISKPVRGSVKIVPSITAKQNYIVDYTSGLITFGEILPEGCNITVSFEFDVPVRFGSDYLELVNNHGDIYSIEKLELIELKL